MTDHSSHLTSKFIASQKAILQDILEQLTRNSNASSGEERQLQSNSLNRSEGSGDDAQKTNLRDNDAARYEHNVVRLRAIRRALEKIDDGTYGLSDESGKPIPKVRLEAVPESVLTVKESAAAESEAQHQR
ncbi:MAG: TraR/DksA family transcriptional regulator [Pseudomonadota bacterium]|nr:TraR/DksA family transcriptional regulator [Pseudomonadota bacterium]